MAYDVLDNVYSIFMDVKTGVGGSSGSNTFYNTDVNTSFIEIILTERDKNLTMTDYTYIVSVDKADGTSYVNRYTASEANKMSIKLDTQLLACEGECTAQLYVLKDDKVRTMMEFNYFVKNGVFDGAKPPSHNEDSIYISLMKEFTDLKENVLIAIGKMDGIESSIESVKNIADTNTNTINSEKKKTEANTSAIEEQGRSITEINNTLQTHSDKIQASEETITQHTEKLQGHDRKLEEYNTTIQEHGRTLESQGASITEQGEKISKNETDITQNKKDIKANTAEINKAKTATTGEKFGSVSERIDAEVSRINNKIEVSFVPQEEAESHTILNTVEGMTTDMVIKGRTLENVIKTETFGNAQICRYELRDGYYNITEITDPPNKGAIVFDLKLPKKLIPDKTYTCIVYEKSLSNKYLLRDNINAENITSVISGNVFTFIPKKESDFILLYYYDIVVGDRIKENQNIVILEGDWTNKPIPEYFEGIKSFGQEEGKIVELSHNRNLMNTDDITDRSINKFLNNDGVISGTFTRLNQRTNTGKFRVSEKTKVIIKAMCKGCRIIIKNCWLDGGEFRPVIDTNNWSDNKNQPILGTRTCYVDKNSEWYVENPHSQEVDFEVKEVGCYLASESNFNYIRYKEDKKEVQLSKYGFEEGLRGLNNTVYDELNSIKDVAVKRIDKNILDGDNEDWIVWANSTGDTVNAYVYFNRMTPNLKGIVKPNSICINDRLPSNRGGYLSVEEGFKITSEYFALSIHKSKLGVENVNDSNNATLLKNWLKQNPITVYYELAEPIETPLTDPINVKTFNEKTYVSFINTLKGTSSFKTPVDTIQTIARLTSENKSLLSSNAELDAKVTEAMKKNQQLKEEAITTQSALDYILMNNLKA